MVCESQKATVISCCFLVVTGISQTCGQRLSDLWMQGSGVWARSRRDLWTNGGSMCSLTAVTGEPKTGSFLTGLASSPLGLRSLRAQTNWRNDTKRAVHDFSVRRTAAGCPAGCVSHDCELNGVGRKVGTCPKKTVTQFTEVTHCGMTRQRTSTAVTEILQRSTRDLVIHMVKMHTNLLCDGGHGPQRAGHAQTTQPTHKTRASGADAEDSVRHVEGSGCWVRGGVGECGGRARRTANDSEREACSSREARQLREWCKLQ